MAPEDLLFWIAAIVDAPTDDPNLLCIRHADAMMVPRGWTLDDRREDALRLFKPTAVGCDPSPPRPSRSRARRPLDPDHTPVQLQIDGTGEIPRPDPTDSAGPSPDRGATPDADPTGGAAVDPIAEPDAPWQPDFDADDDLDGLLAVSSPLLARAFRGTDRPRG